MSAITGTASSYLDLLAQLRAFLTTDATLVGLGQQWTELATVSAAYPHTDAGQVNTVDFESYLVAPGLSGTERIYVNLQAYHNVPADIYNWRINGAVGYDAGHDFFTQPGTSPETYMYGWDQPTPFWFFANGQRVIVVAKVSTTYEMMYAGKFLPYGTPGQYPYPLAIGGTSGNSQGTTDPLPIGGYQANANLRFSDNSVNHAAFFDPWTFYWIDQAAEWHGITHYTSGPAHGNTAQSAVFPWFYADSTIPNWMETDLDGGYPLFAARLDSFSPGNALGELDGVAFVPGFSASSESVMTVGGDDWIQFQDTFRSAANNYCAIKSA
jgi:hypothetical protein